MTRSDRAGAQGGLRHPGPEALNGPRHSTLGPRRDPGRRFARRERSQKKNSVWPRRRVSENGEREKLTES